MSSTELLAKRKTSCSEDTCKRLRLDQPSEKSNSDVEPICEKSNSGVEPISEKSNRGVEPISEKSNSGVEPISEKSNSGVEPISEKSNSGVEPISEKSNSGVEPIGEKSNSGIEPISEKPWKQDEGCEQDDRSNSNEKFPSKKRYAILMGYCGENYKGMMINPGVKTIEEELLKGLERSKLIKPYNAKDIKKLSFQRASRTDKGVSAARQIVSCNLHISEIESDVKTLNDSLPDDIIIYNIIRTTKSYDCHKYASSRVYQYMCPTYAFAGTFADTWPGYRITEDVLDTVQKTLQYFVGTKNFFNYTSGKKENDPSCSRYIRSIECSKQFMIQDTEWVKIKLHGDSFMYHMIRKIIGMTIAVIRNVTPSDYLAKSFGNERIDVPLAPGLGLILDEVKQSRYNTKFGGDGHHQSLDWDQYEDLVNKFKMEKIEDVIYNTEKKARTVLHWLDTLQKHKFYTGHVLPDILFSTPNDDNHGENGTMLKENT